MQLQVRVDPRPDHKVEVTRAMFAQPDQWWNFHASASQDEAEASLTFRIRYRYIIDNGVMCVYFHHPEHACETKGDAIECIGPIFRIYHKTVQCGVTSPLVAGLHVAFTDLFEKCVSSRRMPPLSLQSSLFPAALQARLKQFLYHAASGTHAT